MVFGAKKEEKTMAEAIVEMSKTVKSLGTRMEKMEQTKVTPPPTPEVKPEVKKPIKKQEVQNFIVEDVSVQTEKVIYDVSDEANPIALDIHSALVKILNELHELKKAVG